ncbi:MAG: hypothetical protein SGILL_000154 [Bacillariaceae sp.]
MVSAAANNNTRAGLLDIHTRQLLQNILDLDAQMKGQEQTNSHYAQQQQQQHESTSSNTAAIAAAASSQPAPAAYMMCRETSSSSSSSNDLVQVPCRARGQPPEHDYMTACFTLKKNEKHGKELVCSFRQCRDSGIKFCYCAFCRVPVARRNFRLRHHHSDAKPLSTSKSKHSKHKKSKSHHRKKRRDDRRQQSAAAAAAPTAFIAQAGAVAAAAAAGPNDVSSLLIKSIAQMNSYNSGLSKQQHALSNAPAAMEEVSRLGDSSSSTTLSSDEEVVKIPCRARGMPVDHTIEVRLVELELT